jgi:pimeloyl-ACP methyl ester carboxylesterase
LTDPDPALVAFDALLAGVPVERRALARGSRLLRWLTAGTGDPAIVFEAGAASPATTWAAVFAALAPDHRVIAYDRAGYGASEPATASLELQLADLAAVLESAGPAPCVVVGHSWGALLAQLVAWQRPELVAGLVLVDPSHERLWLDPPDPAALREWARCTDPTVPAGADPRSGDLLDDAAELDREVAHRASDDPGVRALLVAAGRSYLATDEQLRTQLDEFPMILGSLDELAQRRRTAVWPKVPVVTLTATRGRPAEYATPVIEAQERLAAESGATHTVVPDSGHYIHVDRPDLVIRSVREVLTAAASNPP